jgi:16S rRNA (guanine(966)-N(2))-methyltransferase RsmD
VRIIAGTAKGRPLKTPKGIMTRPTQDRIKESMFNILANYGFENYQVLDLFSGTGALGLESLSRGADQAILVDYHTNKIILDNINYCGFTSQCAIIKKDVYDAIRILQGRNFDLVFADPPYNRNFVNPVIASVFRNKLLKKTGIFVMEHSKKEIIDQNMMAYRVFRQSNYGDTVVSFLQSVSE